MSKLSMSKEEQEVMDLLLAIAETLETDEIDDGDVVISFNPQITTH